MAGEDLGARLIFSTACSGIHRVSARQVTTWQPISLYAYKASPPRADAMAW
jgi:hypothetical protein